MAGWDGRRIGPGERGTAPGGGERLPPGHGSGLPARRPGLAWGRAAASALALLAGACSLPRASDPNLLKGSVLAIQDPAAGGSLSDGSLWQDINWTADLRARRVNDLLTIRIAEKTSAVVKGDAATSRVGANNMKATGLAKKLLPGVADGEAVTSNTAMSFKGAGNTGRSAAVTTTITARVVKVLANGNLVFEGYRDIQLNNETQRLYVAGMVNPVFLDAANSIASSQVAELRLGYGGKGVVDETTKPGYVSRMLNYVWPY